MTDTPLACVILAAGRGSRMKSDLPKAMHPLAGRPLIGWLLESLQSLQPQKIIVVTAPDFDDLRASIEPHEAVIQHTAQGTGDAVKAALGALEGFDGDVLILLADMPLISAQTLSALRQARTQDDKTGLSVLGAELQNPAGFGRLVVNADGSLAKIVEDKDCTADQRRLRLCNMGAFCVDAARLAGWVNAIGNDNAQGEYYITDLPAIAGADGAKTRIHIADDPLEIRGVNSRTDLAALEAAVQDRLRARAMAEGATMMDPATVFLSWDTQIGRDVVIEPNVFFGPDVRIADRVTIRAYSHLEGATIESGAVIGPFARLRPGADIGADCRIGNFVEVKNARLAQGVKANHHGYIGDAEIGAGTNFSCGAITVNYDGTKKSKTVIGSGAMIGSNVSLVAPVTVGDGAYIAAGSTITKTVPADALAVAREKPTIVEGWAARKRAQTKAG